jgi:hypothetical protein
VPSPAPQQQPADYAERDGHYYAESSKLLSAAFDIFNNHGILR